MDLPLGHTWGCDDSVRNLKFEEGEVTASLFWNWELTKMIDLHKHVGVSCFGHI